MYIYKMLDLKIQSSLPTPGHDYWIMPWPSQHHGTVHGENTSLGPSPPLNLWENRTLVKQKPISIASSSSTNQLWQKPKNMCQSDKNSCCKYSKTIIPTNRPNKVLYRQVCFHNGRPRPTILEGSWSQRRNTCRSFLGMKPYKGGQWVAIYIYVCIYIYIFIGDVTITSYFLMLHFFWGTISRKIWRRNPFQTENTETWLNFKISKKLHIPKKDIPKKQTSLHNY